MVKPTLSSVIENIEPNNIGDVYLDEQLKTIGHRYSEAKRTLEDREEASEFRSMFFNGQFSEHTGDFIDFLSIAH